MLRLNKLLLNADDARAFDTQIEPHKEQRGYLEECRNRIRDHLREGIRQASVALLGMERQVAPRFRTQGSWAYGLCIQRAHATQEMDWDYGVYLPVKVLKDRTPKVAARAYFLLVERLLDALCKKEGWTLDPSPPETCIRVKVATWAHLDVPLYAAPDEVFETIQERVVLAASAEFAEAVELAQPDWDEMTDIHLAQRDGTWIRSDPARVSRWWRGVIEEYGPQLPRVVRYLKAWRDLWWNTGGPSSVALMVAATQGFQERPRRDDLALEGVAWHLATALTRKLCEPGIDEDEDFLAGFSDDDRDLAAERAKQLWRDLHAARAYAERLKADALAKVTGALGERIPALPDWIEVDVAAEVRATPAATVVPPVVKSTEAG